MEEFFCSGVYWKLSRFGERNDDKYRDCNHFITDFMNTNQDGYIGTQPIRVLQNFIPIAFEKANSAILELTDQLIENLKFNPCFQYHANEFPIKEIVNGEEQTPYATSNNEIHIHETFLSYVWCISYSLLTLYDTAHPIKNNYFTEEEVDKRVKTIHELFSYGTSLINKFSKWDKQVLPNPEFYENENENEIFRANNVFLCAICFILYHEFAHIERQHSKQVNDGKNTSEHRIEFEKEADQKAIDLMRAGATDKTRETVEIGILVGVCCILHYQHHVKGVIPIQTQTIEFTIFWNKLKSLRMQYGELLSALISYGNINIRKSI